MIPKLIVQRTPTSNNIGNDGNGQVANTDVETVDFTGYVVTKGFSSKRDKEGVIPKFFDISILSEGNSLYYSSPEATNLFHPK